MHDVTGVALWVGAALLALNVGLMAWVIIKPGSLQLSEAGIEIAVWWTRRSLPWSQIDQVFKRPIPPGLLIQMRDRPLPVQLSGYTATASQLEAAIKARLRPEATAQVFD